MTLSCLHLSAYFQDKTTKSKDLSSWKKRMKLLRNSSILGRLIVSRQLSTTNSATPTATAEKGLIFDVKPVKFAATEGKTYFWCACGESKKQVRSSEKMGSILRIF